MIDSDEREEKGLLLLECIGSLLVNEFPIPKIV